MKLSRASGCAILLACLLGLVLARAAITWFIATPARLAQEERRAP